MPMAFNLRIYSRVTVACVDGRLSYLVLEKEVENSSMSSLPVHYHHEMNTNMSVHKLCSLFCILLLCNDVQHVLQDTDEEGHLELMTFL